MTSAAAGAARLARRALRRARRAIAGPTPARTERDAFAAYRSLDGPALVQTAPVTVDRAGTSRSLVVLVPRLEPDRLTGGPNTALNIGGRLAARGIPVRFVATHGPVGASEVDLERHVARLADAEVDAIAAHTRFESVHGADAILRLNPADTVMATWWPTAHLAEEARRALGAPEFLYLVQDFEPGFHPWSTHYALALRTYAMPTRAIFNEGLLREHFLQSGIGRFAQPDAAARTIAFEPSVDRALFRPLPHDGRRLLFYARPRNPRNLFEIGLRALRLAAPRLGAGWEVCSIGDQVPELALDASRPIRPIPWQSFPEYARLLGSSDLLLSLMLSPHTSYPPLEMAAAGGRVVTNSFGVKTAAAMAAISPSITAAEPDAELLAEAIVAAAGAGRPDGEAPLALPRTWTEALDPVVEFVLASLR